nr:MAG TPA: hypothetical protein [Caudoviricetes sp.]
MATSAQKNVINKTEDLMDEYKNKSGSSLNKYNAAYDSYKNLVNQGYKPSSKVNNYEAQRNEALKRAEAMGEFSYDSQYKDKIEGLLDSAENMKFNFNYSLTDDPAYQTYRDEYVHNGQMAAQNAAAEAAAQTGGYGSTAASSASQQAYNESLTQLNSVVPELYDSAYQKQWNEFSFERDTLQQLASAYQSLDQQGYEQALATWQNNFNQYITLAQQYNSAYQYLDSAERQQYETKLDGYYNMLVSAQQQYSTDVGAYLDAVGAWSGAVTDAANYDLNAAQLAETKRHNKATEAAAKASTKSSKSVKSYANSEKVSDFTKTVLTSSEFSKNRKKGFYGNYSSYNDYVATMINNWLDLNKITTADAAYLMDYYNLN